MADSIKLDGGQVEQILAARKNAIDLNEELRKFKEPRNDTFLQALDQRLGGVLEQAQSGQRLALRALDFADKLAQRQESFIRFLGLQGGDAAAVRVLADTVSGGLRGARALGAIVPVIGTAVGGIAGAALGSKREEIRQQQHADAIDERNRNFLLDQETRRRQDAAIRERRRQDAATERARARVGG